MSHLRNCQITSIKPLTMVRRWVRPTTAAALCSTVLLRRVLLILMQLQWALTTWLHITMSHRLNLRRWVTKATRRCLSRLSSSNSCYKTNHFINARTARKVGLRILTMGLTLSKWWAIITWFKASSTVVAQFIITPWVKAFNQVTESLRKSSGSAPLSIKFQMKKHSSWLNMDSLNCMIKTSSSRSIKAVMRTQETSNTIVLQAANLSPRLAIEWDKVTNQR